MSAASESITCREIVELVSDYIDGALSPWDRERFEDHLAECEACGTYVEQVRRTIDASGRVAEESLQAPAREAMLLAFRDWKAQRGA